ncbi:MAG: SigB/SigF/SigG family RNA polymerase sigma factor [Clostridia bacterium]|nr:SigB/SigF/SigG family RNA polymerase sigma factor [Clostridia bacterium]
MTRNLLEQSVTQELISKAQDGNNEAKTELIEQNSPLIKSVIRRYRNKGVDYEDLYQLGCIGFLKAIRNFSDSFGVKFSTYAVPMIAGEVKRFLRDDGYIKVSRSVKSLASKINYYIEDYKNKNGDSPSIETIAEEFGIDAQEAVFVLDSAKFPVSLYDKTDDENNRTLMDKLASKETVEDNLDRIVLKDAIQSLDEREKKIILLRYYRDKTQSEVARVLNVSQVQISRLENKILEKLKRGFS